MDFDKIQEEKDLRERCMGQAIEIMKSLDSSTSQDYYVMNKVYITIAKEIEEYIKNG